MATMKSGVGREPRDPRHSRYQPLTEKLLRQVLKSEVGLGKSSAYVLRHEYTFNFSSADRDEVTKLMEIGQDFDDAINAVLTRKTQK